MGATSGEDGGAVGERVTARALRLSGGISGGFLEDVAPELQPE